MKPIHTSIQMAWYWFIVSLAIKSVQTITKFQFCNECNEIKNEPKVPSPIYSSADWSSTDYEFLWCDLHLTARRAEAILHGQSSEIDKFRQKGNELYGKKRLI